jgi:hypothetical protein
MLLNLPLLKVVIISMRFRKFAKKKRLLASSVRPSVHLSVRIQQLGSHWTDFYEI